MSSGTDNEMLSSSGTDLDSNQLTTMLEEDSDSSEGELGELFGKNKDEGNSTNSSANNSTKSSAKKDGGRRPRAQSRPRTNLSNPKAKLIARLVPPHVVSGHHVPLHNRKSMQH